MNRRPRGTHAEKWSETQVDEKKIPEYLWYQIVKGSTTMKKKLLVNVSIGLF